MLIYEDAGFWLCDFSGANLLTRSVILNQIFQGVMSRALIFLSNTKRKFNAFSAFRFLKLLYFLGLRAVLSSLLYDSGIDASLLEMITYCNFKDSVSMGSVFSLLSKL